MRVLNTLYVREHQARVRLQRQALVVATPQVQTRVPLESLEGVVLLGGAQFTTDAIAACVRRGVRVAFLQRNGKLRFTVGGPINGNVHLRVAQLLAALDPTTAIPIARWLVAGKLQNYRRLLQRWSWDADGLQRDNLRTQADVIGDRINALGGATDGDTIRGIEGDATRRYFRGLSTQLAHFQKGLYFEGRNRRPPRDPVNALLSFLYSLLLTEVTGALDGIGLDPQIGFLHGLRPGRPALALDLLEEFRPSVADRLALRLIGRSQIRQDHFVVTPGHACYLSEEGRDLVLRAYERYKEDTAHILLDRSVPRWSLPSIQATLMARHLRGDIPAYPPFVMEP